jgi:hypothetical protein
MQAPPCEMLLVVRDGQGAARIVVVENQHRRAAEVESLVSSMIRGIVGSHDGYPFPTFLPHPKGYGGRRHAANDIGPIRTWGGGGKEPAFRCRGASLPAG